MRKFDCAESLQMTSFSAYEVLGTNARVRSMSHGPNPEHSGQGRHWLSQSCIGTGSRSPRGRTEQRNAPVSPYKPKCATHMNTATACTVAYRGRDAVAGPTAVKHRSMLVSDCYRLLERMLDTAYLESQGVQSSFCAPCRVSDNSAADTDA
jgi:hypothetical protein